MAYKAGSIGAGRSTVMNVFEEKFKDNMKMENAILLGLEALWKAVEGELNSIVVEIGIIQKGKSFKKLTPKEVEKYIKMLTEKS